MIFSDIGNYLILGLYNNTGMLIAFNGRTRVILHESVIFDEYIICTREQLVSTILI